jgi:hypothetical protein
MAEGPGTGLIGMPAAAAARTSRKPGSLSSGVPASDTSAMLSPAAMPLHQARRRALLVVLVQGRQPRLDAEGRQQPAAVARILAKHEVCRGENALRAR